MFLKYTLCLSSILYIVSIFFSIKNICLLYLFPKGEGITASEEKWRSLSVDYRQRRRDKAPAENRSHRMFLDLISCLLDVGCLQELRVLDQLSILGCFLDDRLQRVFSLPFIRKVDKFIAREPSSWSKIQF